MSVRTAQLGDFLSIAGGGTPSRNRPDFFDGPIPWVTVKDLGSEFFLRNAQEHISRAGLDGSASRLIPAGNVLLATRMAVGRAVINKVEVAINQDLKALFCKPTLHPSYLLFFLTHKAPELEAKATGATVKGITIEDIESMDIPLPDLSEQNRIAGLLEQADRLRRARRYALELGDTVLPAAFLELFGDLRQNDHHWPFVELETHAEIVSGVAKGQKYGDRETVEVPYLRVANVQDGYLDLSEIKTIRALPADVESLCLKAGDVVMTEGGDFDKLGRGAIWPGGIVNCIHQNHIFRVRLDTAKLLPAFFAAFLRSAVAKDYFLRCSKQTTNLASINMTQLRATPVPLPPLIRQQHFAKLVARHEHLRASQREALRQADHLFQSLLRRAFGNELAPAEAVEILKPARVTTQPTTISNSKRHVARAVLSAEIVHRLHAEPTFGRTKHQKIFHLCEYIAQLPEIQGQYHREAAGPLDNKLIYANAAELKKQKWYEEFSRKQFGRAYRPLSKAGEHRRQLERYWQEKLPTIERLIELMRTWSTERCEIFSTAYAAWNDLILWNREPTVEAILKEILERWHVNKKRIPESHWRKAINWIRKEGFTPTGFGKPTR